MNNENREPSIEELDAVNGARMSLGPITRVPVPAGPSKYVGQGDTIDTIPWGGHPGDGSWGIVNNNLPGLGPMGN
jgi:hypothetical protein